MHSNGFMSEKNLIDHEFGKLQLNTEPGWWEGKTEISPGHEIFIAFVSEDESPASFLDRIRPVFRRIAEVEKDYRIAAADELLELHNDIWNDDEPIELNAFVDRMRLESLVFPADGNSNMCYHDGDLF